MIRRGRRAGASGARAPARPFAVETTAEDEITVVEVHGEVDIATAPKLREALAAPEVAGAAAVAVDLTGVSFIDSTGLAVVMDLHAKTGARGARLSIACPQGPARLLFDVVGVDSHLPLHDTREAALRALRDRG